MERHRRAGRTAGTDRSRAGTTRGMRSSSRVRSILVAGCLLVASTASWAAAPTTAVAAPKTPKSAPAAAAGFELVADGAKLGTFAELVSISSSVASVGSQGATGKKMTVVLRRPVSASLEVAAWHQLAVTEGASARRATVVQARSAAGQILARYQLTNAYPSKVELTGTIDDLTETVTLTCDQLRRVAP
jgi:hypothetical protein